MNREELIKKHLNVIGVNVMDSAEKHAECSLQAMETYATQQTSDLSTQLAKANSDKERLGELLKEVAPILKSYGMIGRSGHIEQTLQDCGITL
jgi:hypothetical protein